MPDYLQLHRCLYSQVFVQLEEQMCIHLPSLKSESYKYLKMQIISVQWSYCFLYF